MLCKMERYTNRIAIGATHRNFYVEFCPVKIFSKDPHVAKTYGIYDGLYIIFLLNPANYFFSCLTGDTQDAQSLFILSSIEKENTKDI